MREMELSTSSTFNFAGKADTLQRLAPLLKTGRILPIFKLTVAQWRADSLSVIKQCQQVFGQKALIVRSSCSVEDRDGSSGAGLYESILDVFGEPALVGAIEAVIESYGIVREHDEVLVQPMASGVLASGVAMTRDPETGLPYHVVNYSVGSATDSVTAGRRPVRTYISFAGTSASEPDELQGLLSMLEELQRLTCHPALDVEFAITPDGPLLFQVRPMTARCAPPKNELTDIKLNSLLDQEAAHLEASFLEHTKDNPSRPILFGMMPDWNPAEMIGTKPRPMAYSLYRELITDLNWASARFRYGYRDLRRKPLMHQFGGSPYICVSHSLESLIPASAPPSVVDQVVNYSTHFLDQHPHLHDKIEFSIIPTCFTPCLADNGIAHAPALEALDVKSRKGYLTGLCQLTELILANDGPFFSDLVRQKHIAAYVRSLTTQSKPDDPLQHMRSALSAASVAAEVFAGAARAAFVATAIMKSLETQGVIPVNALDLMTGDIKTVGQELANDFTSLHRDDFLRIHGHIRPGTYDIRVPRYDEAPENYFDWQCPLQRPSTPSIQIETFSCQVNVIQHAFERCGLAVSGQHFLTFSRLAIASREKLKYLYSALVSEVLQSLCIWGELQGLDRDDLSFLSIKDFIYGDSGPSHSMLREHIDSNRQRWLETQLIRMPSLLSKPLDIFSHHAQAAHPNFITRSLRDAHVAEVRAEHSAFGIKDCIVLIEHADPGFDWIFTHRIAGFITAYGGENSHMAIRAREFSIPAAIGVGDARFKILSKAKRLRLDCAERRIQVLA